MNKNKRNKLIWTSLALGLVALGAAHASANVGAWTNAGTTGTCNNGESHITADEGGMKRFLWAISNKEGTDVIAQSNTNCTTISASYGNSQVEDCNQNMSRHRCISVP